MPNTFAMAPGYVRKYIREHRLCPPTVDALSFLAERLKRFRLPRTSSRLNHAWIQDIRKPIAWPRARPRARLIFTSPPYLGVMRYAKLNWIRHWLARTDYREVDACLFSSRSTPKYLAFIREALVRCRSVLRDDGFVCLVIGDVRHGDTNIRLGELVASECLDATDLRLVGIVEDRLPVEHKVSRIWGPKKGRATKTDRVLVLAGPRAGMPRRVPKVNWATC
jgi:site-specific DNA-methyltransferase (adenine-specific)